MISIFIGNLGNDEEGFGKVCDGELLPAGEWGGEVLQVDGEGRLHAPATHHHALALHHSLQNNNSSRETDL